MQTGKQHSNYGYGFLSLIVSIVLVAVKFYAYYLTSSNAVLTDALESIINVFASGFALYSIYLVQIPKDRNHPYGHGKVEYFSTGFEGGLIFIAGLYIFHKAILSFFEPPALEALNWGVWLVGGTAIVNFITGMSLIRAGRQRNSITLTGDGQHLLMDAVTSLASCAILAVIHFTGWIYADGVGAMALAAFIIWGGYRMLRKSISGLMDESDMQVINEVIALLQENRKDQWIDIHNLRVQRYGSNLHIDCHVTMPFYFTLEQAHNEIEEIDKLIKNKYSVEVEIFTHIDPCMPYSCRHCSMPHCTVRRQPFSEKIIWNTDNAMKNEKHRL